MNISLVDVDGHNFPNLALMKISAWHKAAGDTVNWYEPLFSNPDRIYASKVFTFTPDYEYYSPDAPEPIKGGTGYDLKKELPEEIEKMLPDYSIYPAWKTAIGFLSRGCIRNCAWCIVPEKEGKIHIVDDIERVAAGRHEVTLMDNNFLANPEDFVLDQLQKAQRRGFRIDFNQALDARLITEKTAKSLARTKWIKYIRFACDTESMLEPVKRAVKMIQEFGYNGQFFVYVLAKYVQETHERIKKLCSISDKIYPFCQPYRNFDTNEPPDKQLQNLARWCNYQAIRKTVSWDNYRYNQENGK